MVDDFKIIVITSENSRSNEAADIIRLLRAGVDRIHIRKPGIGERYVESLLTGIPSDYMCRISLHDFPGLAMRYGTGFHIGGRTSDIPHGVKLSRSCHSLADVSESRGMEYVTLSPVYDSISKHGYMANRSLDSFSPAGFTVPVIALGGVTLDRLDELSRRGFAGAALLGDVWNNPGGIDRLETMLRLRNLRLQFITNGKNVEDTVRQSMMVADGGCRWVQVRLKHSPREEIIEAVKELQPEFRRRGITLLVNDHIDICGETDADGVHIGQKDEKADICRRELGPEKIIGLTVNTLDQLPDALRMPVDYFGIGPYRFTTTKEKLAPTLGLDGYRNFISEMRKHGGIKPFVAIGGITVNDVAELMQVGVPGIAVSGAISGATNPVEETMKFIKTIYQNGR